MPWDAFFWCWPFISSSGSKTVLTILVDVFRTIIDFNRPFGSAETVRFIFEENNSHEKYLPLSADDIFGTANKRTNC